MGRRFLFGRGSLSAHRSAESYFEDTVLKACAGKTKPDHDGEVHRNDLDEWRDADTHFDVTRLNEQLPARSFDTVVFDPPFDPEQASEHYDGKKVGRGPSGGIWQARDALAALCAVGGRVVSIGWNSVGLQHKDGSRSPTSPSSSTEKSSRRSDATPVL